MPHFDIDTNDGNVRRILRDGQPHDAAVSLEQLFSVVTLYFKTATSNLQLLQQEEARPLRRAYGVQCFVMSLTGLEAFTNTYFRLRAGELQSEAMMERIGQRHGSVTRKFEELLAMTPEARIDDQDMIVGRLHELSLLRNSLVHPQWEPASLTLGGGTPVIISGLVQNFQAAFEDAAFCREALMWCLLLVASVGQSRGNPDVSAFLFHWTGIHGLGMQRIKEELGLPRQDG